MKFTLIVNEDETTLAQTVVFTSHSGIFLQYDMDIVESLKY
jgi:hypothetical protein